MHESRRDDSDGSALRRTGRGFVWLTGAKLYFMLAGVAFYFVAPRLIGTMEWGDYLVVLGLVSILNNVFVAAAIQTTSRFVAARTGAQGAVFRAGLWIYGVTGLAAFGLLLFGAPFIAAAEADPGLIPLYRLAAPIVLCYALYAVCIGALNGRESFGAQATFDASYATLRVGLMLVATAWLATAAAAYAAYSTAAALICLTALVLVGGRLGLLRADAGAAKPVGELVRFAMPLAVHQLGLNLLMRTDLLLLKAYGGRFAVDSTATDTSRILAAHYGTAQVFALLPYQALIALAMVVFPVISATANRSEARDRTAAGALRFAVLFGAGLATILAANPAPLIDVIYAPSFRAGGPALRLLAWGILGLSLLTLACAMLNAAGHTGRVLLLTFVTWAGQVGGVLAALHYSDTGAEALRGCGAATCTALAVGGAAGVLAIRLTFGQAAGPSGWTLARAAFAAIAATVVGALFPAGSILMTLLACLVTALAYLALLTLTGELKRGDLDRARTIFGRGNK